MKEYYEEELLECNTMKEVETLKRRIIDNNSILKCDSLEKLDNLKKWIIHKKEIIKFIDECTHLCGYYIDTDIDYQQSTTNYKCLRCGKNITYCKNSLGTVRNINTNYTLSNIFISLYRQLYFEGIDEESIINKLKEFEEFLEKRNVIYNSNKDELNEIILDEFERFNEINKILKKERKKK